MWSQASNTWEVNVKWTIDKVNVFWPVWVILGIILAFKGTISWWVFILIMLSHIEIYGHLRE